MKIRKRNSRRKVVSIQEATAIAARLKRSGKRVVTTNGVFDLLHVGHIRALEFARSLGDALIMGINSDASVRHNKGPSRPLVPAKERAEMLAALSCVNYVFIFSSKTPIPWIKQIRPNVHVKSSDYTLEQVVEREAVEGVGGKVVLFPHTGKHSTSKIIKKIKSL